MSAPAKPPTSSCAPSASWADRPPSASKFTGAISCIDAAAVDSYDFIVEGRALILGGMTFGPLKIEREYNEESGMKIILAGLSLMLALSAYGQGPLSPPGAPGPTMKTLAQVEPRTAITNAPVTISQPGSYYLATNVAGTITLDADHVTLDLMGFRVAASSGSGIVIPTGKGKHTVVRNGVIRMVTAAYGVDGRYIQDGNSRFENLLIDGNDVAWCGLSIGSGCLIRNCDIRNCNNVSGHRRRTLCAVRCNALFGFMFWLLGCFIPGSESSFPPPNQAASAARRILLSFDPNVTVQARPTAEVYTFAAREYHCIATSCGS